MKAAVRYVTSGSGLQKISSRLIFVGQRVRKDCDRQTDIDTNKTNTEQG